MGRKTTVITIDAPGRDSGKSYLLTEMPATQAEKWAIRVLLAMGRSGAEIPEDIVSAGWASLAAMGITSLTGLSWYDAEPLLDEMFTCVQRIEEKITRPLVEDDIEEILTRTKLREEVLSLHLGFRLAEYILKVISALRALNSSRMQTSPPASEQ